MTVFGHPIDRETHKDGAKLDRRCLTFNWLRVSRGGPDDTNAETPFPRG
jgi:hypothetical protein